MKTINTGLDTDPHLGNGCIFKTFEFLFSKKVVYTPTKK